MKSIGWMSSRWRRPSMDDIAGLEQMIDELCRQRDRTAIGGGPRSGPPLSLHPPVRQGVPHVIR